jgi:hypothetical protein
MQRAEKT